ncbi:MAG: sigma-70 family RNA polymerase sigma factor [Rhodobacteraceae bacterium]|nr:sigma-70 family RNA polymerase sigma factor [Paracoccaceae bacterium]
MSDIADGGTPGIGQLEAIYRLERGGLLAYLNRQVGPDVASDLLQDIFLRAASSPQLERLDNPACFLRRIARNLVIDRFRRNRIETIPLFDESEIAVRPEQESGLLARDLAFQLEQALEELPARTALIFKMSRFDSKTYRQIHGELGISVAAVEYHMMKALAHMRASVQAGE